MADGGRGHPDRGVLVARALTWRSGLEPAFFREEIAGDRRVLTSNGLPDHPTGDFPNAHDPVRLRAQAIRFEMPARPAAADSAPPRVSGTSAWRSTASRSTPPARSGTATARCGWQFEVLCPAAAVALGIDINRAHTQGRGMYHYHGLPTGLLWALRRRDPARPMLLLGFAADGFPIYGPEGPGDPDDPGSPIRRLRSSYRLRDGRRPDGPAGPIRRHVRRGSRLRARPRRPRRMQRPERARRPSSPMGRITTSSPTNSPSSRGTTGVARPQLPARPAARRLAPPSGGAAGLSGDANSGFSDWWAVPTRESPFGKARIGHGGFRDRGRVTSRSRPRCLSSEPDTYRGRRPAWAAISSSRAVAS